MICALLMVKSTLELANEKDVVSMSRQVNSIQLTSFEFTAIQKFNFKMHTKVICTLSQPKPRMRIVAGLTEQLKLLV